MDGWMDELNEWRNRGRLVALRAMVSVTFSGSYVLRNTFTLCCLACRVVSVPYVDFFFPDNENKRPSVRHARKGSWIPLAINKNQPYSYYPPKGVRSPHHKLLK